MDLLFQKHHSHVEHSPTGFAPMSLKSSISQPKALGAVTKDDSLHPGGLRHLQPIPGCRGDSSSRGGGPLPRHGAWEAACWEPGDSGGKRAPARPFPTRRAFTFLRYRVVAEPHSCSIWAGSADRC